MNEQARSLLDRYVYAIHKLLPRAQRDDIATELREILESQVDDEESRERRSLDKDEIVAILKRFGPPRQVASRYGSRQYLIGPEVFPSYLVALKVVLWVMVPLMAFAVALTAVTAREHLLSSLLGTFWSVLSFGLVNVGIVTLLFVYFGRASSGKLKADDWDLDDLPEVPEDPKAPLVRSESIGALVGLVLMLGWWLGLNEALRRLIGLSDSLPLVWAPVWTELTPAAVSLIFACMAMEVMGLLRPKWIKPYLASGAFLDLLVLLLLLRLLGAGTYVGVDAGTPHQGSMSMLVFLFNGMLFAGLLVISIGIAVSCARKIWRLLRMSHDLFHVNQGTRN